MDNFLKTRIIVSGHKFGQLIKMDSLNIREVALLREGGASFEVSLKPVVKKQKIWYRCEFVIRSVRHKNEERKTTKLVTTRGEDWVMQDLNKAVEHIKQIFPDIERIDLYLPAADADTQGQ